jgi:hypothetical protein
MEQLFVWYDVMDWLVFMEKKMRLYQYKVRWSPYSTAIRAKSKKDAAERIRKAYPKARGDFFTMF